MFSRTLMKQTIKSNLSLLLIMTVLQGGMVALISALGQNVEATGIMFYRMLPSVFSAIYVIITGNKLIAAQIDKGTMAYVLSTSISRLKVAVTQAIFFLGSIFTMFFVSAGAHALVAKLTLETFTSNDLNMIINLNLGSFALALAFSGICLLGSCIFNLSKNATAFGGGIVGGFILIFFLPLFSKDLRMFDNFTIVSLFDIDSITRGTSDYLWKVFVLIGIGIVTYVAGIRVFTKKDLPL